MYTRLTDSKIQYSEQLKEYYPRWYQDAMDSAKYLRAKGRPDEAIEYEKRAEQYKQIIIDNGLKFL